VRRDGRSGNFLTPIFTMTSAIASSILPSSFSTVLGSIYVTDQKSLFCSSLARRSRDEPWVVLDGFHALVRRKSVENANLFARVPHEIKGKLAVTEGFHPSKHRIEGG
jgi:hypothetical protein